MPNEKVMWECPNDNLWCKVWNYGFIMLDSLAHDNPIFFIRLAPGKSSIYVFIAVHVLFIWKINGKLNSNRLIVNQMNGFVSTHCIKPPVEHAKPLTII